MRLTALQVVKTTESMRGMPGWLGRAGLAGSFHPEGERAMWGVYGGAAFAGFSNLAQAYTPNTNTWTLVASLQTYHANFGAVTGRDGRIYALGGLGYSGTTNLVEVYTPRTNRWTYVADLPTPRSGLAAVTAPDGRTWF